MSIKRLKELRDAQMKLNETLDEECGTALEKALAEVWKRAPLLRSVRIYFDAESDSGEGPLFINTIELDVLKTLGGKNGIVWTWAAGTYEDQRNGPVPFDGAEAVSELCSLFEYFAPRTYATFGNYTITIIPRPKGV